MKYTTNLKLKKPDYTDPADVADFNSNMDAIDLHSADTTKHVTKDGTLQTGLNAQKVNGVQIFVGIADPTASYTVNNNDIWYDTTSGSEIIKIRVSGAWIPMGAVYK